jgi:hypothetical protein
LYLLVLKLKNILLIDSHFTIFDILLSLSAIFKLYHDWFNWEGSSRHLLNSKTMTFGRCILSLKLEVDIRTCTYIYSLTWLQLHFSCNSRAYFRLRSIPVTLPPPQESSYQDDDISINNIQPDQISSSDHRGLFSLVPM